MYPVAVHLKLRQSQQFLLSIHETFPACIGNPTRVFTNAHGLFFWALICSLHSRLWFWEWSVWMEERPLQYDQLVSPQTQNSYKWERFGSLSILCVSVFASSFLTYFIPWFDSKMQKRDLGVITSLAWCLYTLKYAVNIILHIVQFYAPRECNHLEDFCPNFLTDNCQSKTVGGLRSRLICSDWRPLTWQVLTKPVTSYDSTNCMPCGAIPNVCKIIIISMSRVPRCNAFLDNSIILHSL